MTPNTNPLTLDQILHDWLIEHGWWQEEPILPGRGPMGCHGSLWRNEPGDDGEWWFKFGGHHLWIREDKIYTCTDILKAADPNLLEKLDICSMVRNPPPPPQIDPDWADMSFWEKVKYWLGY